MDMRALAKQLKTKQLSPSRVVFEFGEEQWVFESPNVVEANMMGNRIFQVIGTYSVEKGINKEDLELIMDKTGCDIDTAKEALKKCGDVAEAIIYLSEKDN